MPTFNGRVEARLTVPSGGAAISASNSGGGATTVTVPAASYYLTAAGGVSSLLTEFQSQLNASRAPSSGSWTVSLSTTTGLVSIACTGTTAVPSFSLDWSNTVLRDICGFAYNINYPTDATELARQLGYGNWTSGAGYLFNEPSGNLAAAFGSPALAPGSTPTYGHQGPRGGADKAIGFDSANDRFDGGNVFNVSGTDDLIVAMVVNINSIPSRGHLIQKITGSGAGWQLWLDNSTGRLRFQGYDASTANLFDISLVPTTAAWATIIAVIDRSTGRVRLGMCPLGGSPTVTTEATVAATTMVNAIALRVGDRADAPGWAPIDTKIAALYIVSGAGVATGLSANLSTALSNFAATFGTWTGTKQAKGVVYMDCPLNMEGNPRRAPIVSDLRQSMSPTGQVLGLVGNTYKRHRNLVWSHVPAAQVWDAEATYANGSWEEFFAETQLGLGSSWFTPSSPVQIYDHNNVQVGIDANVAGWFIVGLDSIEPRKSSGDWTGLWRIEIPQIVAVGS